MLKHLASGGMADVLLGRSDGIEGFERHVVLKRIRPELARDQRFIRMFLDEARVAATLHHQHIVQVHDIGESDGEYFIAMEYVHGEDVRKILSTASKRRAHVPLDYAVAIVSAAAAGLHYAHDRCGSDKQPFNIVHRDVSPSNILVGYDGSIKVVDFGIATASMRQETRSGSLKGKLSYMSPEQCKGHVVDRRSDVYSLGVVLYELATTTRMIKSENDYLAMEQIVKGRITPPHVRRAGLSSELSEIIMRALATDRDERYATADELRAALDQFASTAGLTASTSVIATYMRQQFGQRPEPWLELGGIDPRVLDDVPTAIDGAASSSSWTESPRSDGDLRGTRPIPLHTGPLGVITGELAAPTGEPLRALAEPPTTPAPTDARKRWESLARPPRRLSAGKLAMICGVPIAGIAIWLVAGRGGTTAPAADAPAAASPAAATLVVAEPPAVVEVVVTGLAGPPHDSTVRAPEPVLTRKARSAPPIATPQAVTRSPVESPRPERPARPAVVASTESASAEVGSLASELHRTVVPSPPAPPPPVAPAPAVAAITAPAAAAPPQVVAPSALDANRIAGDKNIVPDGVTMTAIGRSGQDSVVSTYKVCVTADGAINAVTLLRSTGFASYDAKIQDTIRRDWRFRPFVVNGKPAAVCTALRFLYSQK
jgi:serine/threonine protein kinase